MAFRALLLGAFICACIEDTSVLDASPDGSGPEDSGVDAADAASDGNAEDAASACEPFSESAPRPPSLASCVRTLEREPLEPAVSTVDSVEVRQNVPFARRGEYTLHGDLHLPARTSPSGALLVVHGGGWLDCDNRRDATRPLAQAFAARLGVPTFNVDYRLAQEGGGYPENLMDIKCAVQWLRAHSEELQIDAERIGVLGTSAGAHLALMTALTSERDDLDPACEAEPTDIQLAISYAAPSDLPRFVRSESIARQAPLFYTGEPCDEAVTCQGVARGCTRCADASPLAHACRPSQTEFLLMQAPDPYDRFVAQLEAESLAEALRTAANRVSLRIPSDEEMRAAGCTPEGGSHAADLCMIQASQALVNPRIVEQLGPRE